MAGSNGRDTYRSANVVISKMPGDYVDEMLADSGAYFTRVHEASRSDMPSRDELRRRAGQLLELRVEEDLRRQSESQGLLVRIVERLFGLMLHSRT